MLNPPQTLRWRERWDKENKGLSRSGSGLPGLSPQSIYLQPAGARGRHTPEPAPAHSGPKGPATHRTDDLLWPFLCFGPLGQPISSGTTHNLCVNTLCPLSRQAQHYSKTHTHSGTYSVHINKETHSCLTLYRQHILPHANTICHTQQYSTSPSLPQCVSHSVSLSLSISFWVRWVLSVKLVNISILWTKFVSLWKMLRGKCLLPI